MVPDKFNMVDMEGIDIIESQGEAVEGLYQKLVESIAQCRYQCLYNWKFDGILIPPTYVEMDIVDDVVRINEGVSVDEEDVIRIYSLEPPAPEPNILELSVTENGTYVVPEGYDGYNPVSVDVPAPQPVLDSLSVTANGTYTPPSGVDGYNTVTVSIPAEEPSLQSLSVTENGTYSPPTGYDGFSDVSVDVSGQMSENFYTYLSYLQYGIEYTGYIYGTSKIEECNLVLLADTSQSPTDSVVLSSSINNYSAIVLQGVYQGQRTAQWNTTSLYTPVLLNHSYWAGMKDRNSSYTCTVTFTDDTHATLTGNRQVLIYGMP